MNNRGFALILVVAIVIAVATIGLGGYSYLLRENGENQGKDVATNSTDMPAHGSDDVPEMIVKEEEYRTKNEAVSPENLPKNNPQDVQVPSLLSLPFNITEIDKLNGEVNPIGIVRFSKDRADIGHSGLDVPLPAGAEILSVGDGKIVLIGSAGDPWGGKKVFQLLKETIPGEGWGFLYEHITPKPDLEVGLSIGRGEVVGIKTAPTGFTAHFQLSYLFNNYEFIRDIKCWPDLLKNDDKASLDTWWAEYRTSSHLVGSWNSTIEEEKYPFRGLLNTSLYPSGPQLCYPLGTDAR